MLTTCSYLKLNEDDFTIDPLLEKIVHLHKRIGEQIYESYTDIKYITEDKNYLSCFPESNLNRMNLKIRSIHINNHIKWDVPVEYWDELEWKDMFENFQQLDSAYNFLYTN